MADEGKTKPGARGTTTRARITLIPSKLDSNGIRSSTEIPARLREPLAMLLTHEDEMLAWLSADSARAAQFVLDPVGTLRASKLDLPEDLLAGLEQGLTAIRRSDVVPANVKLDSITVNVRPAHNPGSREGGS